MSNVNYLRNLIQVSMDLIILKYDLLLFSNDLGLFKLKEF